jgi:hypothetical protein
MKSLIAAVTYILAGCMLFIQDAAAQNRKLPLIGILWVGNATKAAPYLNPLVARLRDLGWIDGKTAKFVIRYDGDEPTRFPALAKELVSLRVDVLVITDAGLAAAQ